VPPHKNGITLKHGGKRNREGYKWGNAQVKRIKKRQNKIKRREK
jgi:hypothetical protein